MMKINDVIEGMKLYGPSPSCFWKKSGVSFEILDDTKGLRQRSGQTVFEHTMNVLDCLAVCNEITLLAGLFHDCGKLHTRTIKGDRVNFWGHELVSAEMAWHVLPSWGTHPQTIDCVARIIKTHMIDIKTNMTRSKIRSFIAAVGYDNIDNWFVLRKADSSAYSQINNNYPLASKEYQKAIIDPFEHKVLTELAKIYSGSDIKFDPSIIGEAIRISGE